MAFGGMETSLEVLAGGRVEAQMIRCISSSSLAFRGALKSLDANSSSKGSSFSKVHCSTSSQPPGQSSLLELPKRLNSVYACCDADAPFGPTNKGRSPFGATTA